MGKYARFAVQRTDDARYWAGDSEWVTDADLARTYRSKRDAVTAFVLDRPTGQGWITFNPVPVHDTRAVK